MSSYLLKLKYSWYSHYIPTCGRALKQNHINLRVNYTKLRVTKLNKPIKYMRSDNRIITFYKRTHTVHTQRFCFGNLVLYVHVVGISGFLEVCNRRR